MLALTQVELDVSSLGATEQQAKAASFAAALKTARRCRDGASIAKSLGAAMVERDSIAASDLPEPVRALLSPLKVGMATVPFGGPAKLRALVLCGRKTSAAAPGDPAVVQR